MSDPLSDLFIHLLLGGLLLPLPKLASSDSCSRSCWATYLNTRSELLIALTQLILYQLLFAIVTRQRDDVVVVHDGLCLVRILGNRRAAVGLDVLSIGMARRTRVGFEPSATVGSDVGSGTSITL